MSKRVVLSLLVLVVCQLTVGCTSNKPKYTTPQLPPEQSVTLKAGMDTWIVEVDDQVATTVNTMGWGHNTVVVAPGPRKLKVYVRGPKVTGPVPLPVPGRLGDRTSVFELTCEAGHTYGIDANGALDNRVEVTDEASGASTVIDF